MLKALSSMKNINRFQFYNIVTSHHHQRILFNYYFTSSTTTTVNDTLHLKNNKDTSSKNDLSNNSSSSSSNHNNITIKVDNNKIIKDNLNITEVTPFDLENEMFLIRKKMIVNHQNGNYQIALDHALDLEDRAKKLYPNTRNAVYASCLNNSALMLKLLGNQESAVDKYIEALQVYDNVTGKNHTSYASTLSNLGVLYKDMTRQKKGIEKSNLLINCKEALQDSFELRTKLLGPNHKDTVYSSIHLASYHRLLCSNSSSTTNTTNSTYISSNNSGTNIGNTSTATSSNNKDDDEIHIREAEQLLVSALATAQTNWGEVDIICATIHNDLGLLYKSKLQYDQAKEHYSKALNIRSKVIGDEHPETIITLHNLAELYNRLGDTKNEDIIRKQLLNMIQIDDNSTTINNEKSNTTTTAANVTIVKNHSTPTITTSKQVNKNFISSNNNSNKPLSSITNDNMMKDNHNTRAINTTTITSSVAIPTTITTTNKRTISDSSSTNTTTDTVNTTAKVPPEISMPPVKTYASRINQPFTRKKK